MAGWLRSGLRLPRNESDVERNRDEQVRARLERPGGTRRLIRGDSPDVAHVVAIGAALRIRPVERRREQAVLIERADELHIVVVVGDTVFLEAPIRFDAADLEIVAGVRLPVRPVPVRDGVELL